MTHIADASAAASRYAEEVARLDGRARELVEAKLRIEAERLEKAERQLWALDQDVENFASLEHHRDWVTSALRDFSRVWSKMTPENQGCLLRALVAGVRVNETTGTCKVELVKLDTVARDAEAAA